MDIALIVIWALLCVVAIIGAIIPVLPSLILIYIACILLQLTSGHPFGLAFFIIRAVIIIFLTILDYAIPSRGTKKFGGSKRGVRGSNIWLIVAVIVLPIFGIVLGPFWLLWLVGLPFLWAYLGEKFAGKHHELALKAARGSFIGFVTWTLLKLVISIVMTIYFVSAAYHVVVK